MSGARTFDAAVGPGCTRSLQSARQAAAGRRHACVFLPDWIGPVPVDAATGARRSPLLGLMTRTWTEANGGGASVRPRRVRINALRRKLPRTRGRWRVLGAVAVLTATVCGWPTSALSRPVWPATGVGNRWPALEASIVYFAQSQSPSLPVYKPATLEVAGEGSFIVTGVQWRSWSDRTAAGAGVGVYGYAGRTHYRDPVSFVLSAPRRACGRMFFTHGVFYFPHRVPNGVPRRWVWQLAVFPC
jgi:hypothetical protein